MVAAPVSPVLTHCARTMSVRMRREENRRREERKEEEDREINFWMNYCESQSYLEQWFKVGNGRRSSAHRLCLVFSLTDVGKGGFNRSDCQPIMMMNKRGRMEIMMTILQ